MKLTLYVDWYGVDDDDLIKQQKSIVELPNNDGYHLFEAWMHLSRCERVDYRIVDGVIEGLYDIIVEVMEERYIELIAGVADIIQIGSRNMQNYPLLTACAKTGKPIDPSIKYNITVAAANL